MSGSSPSSQRLTKGKKKESGLTANEIIEGTEAGGVKGG